MTDTAHAAAARPRRRHKSVVRVAAAALLLIAWAAWWVASLQGGRLVGHQLTRIPAWQYLGFDFRHNYSAARFWMAGGNPFVQDFGDPHGLFAYPPAVLPFFAWCALVPDVDTAVAIWMAGIAGVVAGGAWVALRTRALLALTPLPLMAGVALALCSMPVLFAMERGQCDAIPLLMIAIAALAFERPASWKRDVLIGACLSVAAWTKLYPAVALAALVPLRAWRPLALGVLQAALIGLLPYRTTMEWLSASASSQHARISFLTEIVQWARESNHTPAQLSWYAPITDDSHSLSTYWATFWNYFDFFRLARTPGMVGAALVLSPLVLWLCLRVYASPGRRKLAYPFMLWMTAAATFGMPVSFDYNLIFLVLAALAVCDRRDGWSVTVPLAASVLWWQPLIIPVPHAGDLLFFLKLFALAAVGISIAIRARKSAGRDAMGSPVAEN